LPVPDGLARTRGARILLAEDNEINRQIATELLEGEGFRVTAVDNGSGAVNAVRTSETTFDAVLMDLQMPDMDGYEATREIRREKRFLDLPIIAMTADVVSGVEQRVREFGMNDYVSKPINPNLFLSVLTAWIRPRDGLGEAPSSQSLPGDDSGTSSFPGIDIEAALARVAGKMEILVAMLKKFARNHHRAVDDIRSAIGRGEMELAKRLAHTLKGVSGSIGADGLHQAARELETVIKQESAAQWASRLDAADLELARVLDAIASLKPEAANGTPSERPTAKPGSRGPGAMASLLAEFRRLLEQNDTEAKRCFETVRIELADAGVHEELREMEKVLGLYDFDGAVDVLSSIDRKIVAADRRQREDSDQ
jgi:CheY-like chemotaxis protein